MDPTSLGWAVKNLAAFAGLGVKLGPIRAARSLRRYPWTLQMARVNRLMSRLMGGRRGAYREATGMVLHQLVAGGCEYSGQVVCRPDRVVWHKDLVPADITLAMGLVPLNLETVAISVTLLDAATGSHYVDQAENAGIPSDICTLPRMTLGMTIADHMPPGQAIVCCNMPCDAGTYSFTHHEKFSGLPTFRLDTPFRYRDDRAVAYYVSELRAMITFLEEHTPGRMDWERLRTICDERNRAREAELEFWELQRSRPAPLGADVIFLSHLSFYSMMTGNPRAARMFQGLTELARRSLAEGGALPEERFRVLMWNPPAYYFPEVFSWAESEFSAISVMDMMSYNQHGFVDTSSPDSMLCDLARIYMEGPMSQHTRGPAEYFFEDLFSTVDAYSIDTVWMAGHVVCKNTQGLLGMLREKCRRRKIPLLVMRTDLGDQRVVSPDSIQTQISRFMHNVMGC